MEETPYLKGQTLLIAKLRKLPFLSSFDDSFTEQIFSLSKLRSYRSGETITPEGVYDSWIYLIVSGEAVVMKSGRELTRLHTGDAFGELTILDGEARSASVNAASDTVCLAMDASILDRLAPAQQSAFYSIFYRLFAEILAHRLRAADEELIKIKQELEKQKS